MVAIGLFALLAIAGSVSGSETHPLTEAETQWLAAHGPIRYGYEQSYAPFEFTDRDGNPAGINLDFVDRMSRHLSLDVTRIPYPSLDAMLADLQSGKLDLIGGLNRTPERDAYLDFTTPYLRLDSAFYTLQGPGAINDLDDIAAVPVGVIAGYNSGGWLRQHHPNLDVAEASNVDQLISWLIEGRVDVVFEESATIGFAAKERGLTTLRRVPVGAGLVSLQHWVVPEGESTLLGIIEKGLHAVGPGERGEIFAYWTGQDLSVPRDEPWRLSEGARRLLLGAGVLLIAAGLWVFTLRGQVRRRTRELAHELARRQEAEVALRQSNEALEERVKERTEQLRRSNRDLRQFALTVTHDLRAPLSAIIMGISVLRTRVGGDERAIKTLDRMDRVSDQMERVITETLEQSRATQSHPMTATNLEGAAEEAKLLLEPQILAAPDPIEITIHPLPWVFGSRSQLVQLFQNLFANAIQYRKPGQACKIEVWSDGGDDTNHAVFIEDNGQGFTDEVASHLLEMFERGERTGEGGYGIGLANCARIVERHGGSLIPSGKPGVGARFTVHLPKSARVMEQEAVQTATRPIED